MYRSRKTPSQRLSAGLGPNSTPAEELAADTRPPKDNPPPLCPKEKTMFKLTKLEMTAEIYAVLRRSPHGDDLNVSKVCAAAIMRAEAQKEEG